MLSVSTRNNSIYSCVYDISMAISKGQRSSAGIHTSGPKLMREIKAAELVLVLDVGLVLRLAIGVDHYPLGRALDLGVRYGVPVCRRRRSFTSRRTLDCISDSDVSLAVKSSCCVDTLRRKDKHDRTRVHVPMYWKENPLPPLWKVEANGKWVAQS